MFRMVGFKKNIAVIWQEIVLSLMMIFITWASFEINLVGIRDRELYKTEQSIRIRATNLQELVEKDMLVLDRALISMKSSWIEQKGNFDIKLWASDVDFPDKIALRGLIADGNGRILSSTGNPSVGSTVVQEDFFVQAKNLKDGVLFVSLPYERDRYQTVWLVRKLNADKNSGIVALALDPMWLWSLRMRDDDQTLGILLFDTQTGRILSKAPVGFYIDNHVDQVAKNLAGLETSGIWRDQQPLINYDAISLVKKLNSYPMAVMVGIPTKIAMYDYNRAWILYHLVALLTTFVITVTGISLMNFKRKLNLSKQILWNAVENIGQGLLMINSQGKVLTVNKYAKSMLGIGEENRVKTWFELLEIPGFLEVNKEVATYQTNQQTAVLEKTTGSGKTIEVRVHRLADESIIYVYTDITLRKTSEEKIRYLAYHDGLTNLANRRMLNESLAKCLSKSALNKSRFAVLCLDLDRFKLVNDSYGHSAGDQLLVQVAQRLKEQVSDGIVARLGGDEFTVVLTNPGSDRGIIDQCNNIIVSIHAPYEICGYRVEIGTSIGVSLYPEDGDTADGLMKASDQALYKAKEDGKGRFCFSSPDRGDLNLTSRNIIDDLKYAVQNKSLKVVFQPLVSCSSGALQGFEALARWDRPFFGAVAPDVFIRIAEENGLIIPLGKLILNLACEAAKEWSAGLRVNVNLSATQFLSPDLITDIQEILDKQGLSADRLELELTEGTLIKNTAVTEEKIEILKGMGINIALDDFGTGFSSLSYLKKFRFNRVKIDKSFIDNLEDDPTSQSIVQNILTLARDLEIAVTAEGVETLTQWKILKAMRCGEIQGYYIGKPIGKEDIPIFIAREKQAEIII